MVIPEEAKNMRVFGPGDLSGPSSPEKRPREQAVDRPLLGGQGERKREETERETEHEIDHCTFELFVAPDCRTEVRHGTLKACATAFVGKSVRESLSLIRGESYGRDESTRRNGANS